MSMATNTYIPYAQLLTNEVCQGLPFLYAVTSCDTVSMFSGHGKKTAWKVWKSFPEARSIFARFQSKIYKTTDFYV